jgi:hypothetical protein
MNIPAQILRARVRQDVERRIRSKSLGQIAATVIARPQTSISSPNLGILKATRRIFFWPGGLPEICADHDVSVAHALGDAGCFDRCTE